jgi:cytochrome P450
MSRAESHAVVDKTGAQSGFLDNGTIVKPLVCGRGRGRPLAMRGEGRTPVVQLDSYFVAVQVFAAPLGTLAPFPNDIAHLVQRISEWQQRCQSALGRLQNPPVFRQVLDFGSVVFDTHRLLGAVNKKRIDDWLSARSTEEEAKAAFESWRGAFLSRYDAIRALCADILVSSNLSMFDDNPLDVLIRNIHKLADVFAGRRYAWGGAGVALGLSALALRERRFLWRLIGSQLAATGITFAWFREARQVHRLNALAGEALITRRHATQLQLALQMLRQHGVVGAKADEIVLAALRQGDRAASKPWKGLLKLRQLIVHSGIDPRASDFIEVFLSLTDAPVQYTHTPGLEWVVRDYELGKKLLQMDGRIPEGSQTATLQQGRVSVMPGIAKATPGATEFARKYFGPVENFLNSMVTADGADHQRHRKPFMQFFSRRAVFDQAELVQDTVTMLLNEAERIARKNQGAFDLKKHFAFQFPIRIICGIVGIGGTDIETIQRWTEQSTRAMDTEAGVSIMTARRGQTSAQEQRAFFGKLLNDARAGKPGSDMVKALAFDDTLSEAERIANLSVIIFAGFETTTGLLCKGVSELLKHPEQWAFLRDSLVDGPEIAVESNAVSDVDLRWYRWAETEPREADPIRRERIARSLAKSEPLRQRLEAIKRQEARLDAAIEEMLRWSAPGSIIPLTASQDLEVPVPRAMLVRGEQLQPGDMLKIAKGETVTVAVDEINRRCPFGAGEFDLSGAGTFDISRADNTKHLSFGVKHMCIGATLARENAKRALEGLLRRFPDLESNGTPIPQDMELFHGLASLPVRSPSMSY